MSAPAASEPSASRRWRPALLVAGGAAGALAATAALAAALALLLGGTGWLAAPISAALAAAVAVCGIALPLAVLLVKLSRQLERSRQQLARLDTTDAVTGVASRGHFLALAEREWARARRYGSGAALLLLDIDRYQRLTSTRGQVAGELVLRALARHTEPSLRGADALARYSRSQLVVWLAHADPTGALDVAERIRERIEALDVPGDPQVRRVTVSVGVAALRPAHQTLAALIDDAEAALHAARQAGGNCVRAAPVDPLRLRKAGPSIGPSSGPSVGDNRAAG